MKSLVISVLLIVLYHNSLQARQSTLIDKEALATEVRTEFLHAWNAYKKYAWGEDGLRPISKKPYRWHSASLMMTAVDAMDTMLLMGLKVEADSVREYIVANLSFDHDMFVDSFEITIRLLGGLLSVHQMTGDVRLLEMAEDLGNRLLPIFQTPTGIPYAEINLKTGEIRNPKTNPGKAGTLLIEFGTLAKLTGRKEFYDLTKRAVVEVYNRRSSIGLVGTWIDANTGEWLDPDSHLSACIDSYYEYLIKCAILFEDHDFRQMWDSSYEAVKTYLAHEAPSGLWFGHANMNTGERTKTWFGALDAYFPATLVLAGELQTAARLQESCLNMWNRYGIEPEQIDYITMNVPPEPKWERYFLNPEIMESTYYLYCATRDDKYLEMGVTFLESLKRHCRLEEGYSELKSVVTMERSDRMESYFLSETLKYLYLLFAPPETLDFNHVIFNSEAHPVRRTW